MADLFRPRSDFLSGPEVFPLVLTGSGEAFSFSGSPLCGWLTEWLGMVVPCTGRLVIVIRSGASSLNVTSPQLCPSCLLFSVIGTSIRFPSFQRCSGFVGERELSRVMHPISIPSFLIVKTGLTSFPPTLVMMMSSSSMTTSSSVLDLTSGESQMLSSVIPGRFSSGLVLFSSLSLLLSVLRTSKSRVAVRPTAA